MDAQKTNSMSRKLNRSKPIQIRNFSFGYQIVRFKITEIKKLGFSIYSLGLAEEKEEVEAGGRLRQEDGGGGGRSKRRRSKETGGGGPRRRPAEVDQEGDRRRWGAGEAGDRRRGSSRSERSGGESFRV